MPKVYAATQEILAGSGARDRLVRDFLQPRSGERILKIDCGSASLLPHPRRRLLPWHRCHADHIEQAIERHDGRATFGVGDLSAAPSLPEAAYDQSTALAFTII